MSHIGAVSTSRDALAGWLAESGASPGDRLPPERELSERLGFSRGELRKALTALEAEGVITAYRARVNRRKLGIGFVAYVTVGLSVHTKATQEAFERAMALSDEVREKFIGYAEIREVFKVSGVGKVAGCLVTEGVARRSAGVRLLRDDVVIHEGTLKTLKRFKDEVAEVQSGQECGMAFDAYDDIRQGDVIEIFERESVERNL